AGCMVIHPRPTGGWRSWLPQVHTDGGEAIGFKPPLGILYVASTLADRSAHEVLVVDAVAERLSFEDIAERARAFNPAVVGLSAWTAFWYPPYRTRQLIKEVLPHPHLSVGGPHGGIFPPETLDRPLVVTGILRDGETPFL